MPSPPDIPTCQGTSRQIDALPQSRQMGTAQRRHGQPCEKLLDHYQQQSTCSLPSPTNPRPLVPLVSRQMLHIMVVRNSARHILPSPRVQILGQMPSMPNALTRYDWPSSALALRRLPTAQRLWVPKWLCSTLPTGNRKQETTFCVGGKRTNRRALAAVKKRHLTFTSAVAPMLAPRLSGHSTCRLYHATSTHRPPNRLLNLVSCPSCTPPSTRLTGTHRRPIRSLRNKHSPHNPYLVTALSLMASSLHIGRQHSIFILSGWAGAQRESNGQADSFDVSGKWPGNSGSTAAASKNQSTIRICPVRWPGKGWLGLSVEPYSVPRLF
jgi:hypothetical protein